MVAAQEEASTVYGEEDLRVQAEVSEAEDLSAIARAAVAEFYQYELRYPTDNREAGLVEAHELNGRYVTAVSVRDGLIRVEFGGEADPAISGRSIEYTLDSVGTELEWACSSVYIESRYLPPTCR